MLKPLLPFQVAGAMALASHPHHLLADEPGLGKTLQAISAAKQIGTQLNLVVCPASVRSNWLQEIEECLGSTQGWRVISYNKARDLAKSAERAPLWDAIILDESHFVKNMESLRCRAIFGNGHDGDPYGLARRAKYKWCLSGTPVLNRPSELYPILKTLHPAFAGMTFAAYAQKYCGAYWDGRQINTKGASHLAELAALLGPDFMTRRTKKMVFPDRKEPIIEVISLDVSKQDLAAVFAEEKLIEDREAYLSPTREKYGQLGDLSHLLKLTGEAKVRSVIAYLEDLLFTVDKIVVFFHHTEVGAKLFRHFDDNRYAPVLYQGGMTDRQKDEQKRIFMERSESRIFLGQMQTCGLGINGLQEVCTEAAFAEQSWVPGEMGQCIDRLDRMNHSGKFLDCVTARIFHAPGTLESALLGSRAAKSKVIGRLMNDDGREWGIS